MLDRFVLLGFGPSGWGPALLQGAATTLSVALATLPFGLGLGLFLTHTALSHLGGDISFSDAPGGGARVTVNLPLARLQTGT